MITSPFDLVIWPGAKPSGSFVRCGGQHRQECPPAHSARDRARKGLPSAEHSCSSERGLSFQAILHARRERYRQANRHSSGSLSQDLNVSLIHVPASFVSLMRYRGHDKGDVPPVIMSRQHPRSPKSETRRRWEGTSATINRRDRRSSDLVRQFTPYAGALLNCQLRWFSLVCAFLRYSMLKRQEYA